MKRLILCVMVVFSITMMAQEVKTHTIQRGETIESIAAKYQVSVDAIKKANPNVGEVYYVGMKLNIPAATVTQAPLSDDPQVSPVSNVSQAASSRAQQKVTENTSGIIATNENGMILNSSTSSNSIQQPNENNNDDDELTGAFALTFYSFDGFQDYGFSDYFIKPNGLSGEFGIRLCFDKYGHYNAEVGLNYSFLLFKQNKTRLFFTLSVGPSLRMQYVPEFEFNQKTGMTNEKSKEKWFVDGYANGRLSLMLNKVMFSAGVFFGAPEFKLSKDDGAQVGVNLAIGIDV